MTNVSNIARASRLVVGGRGCVTSTHARLRERVMSQTDRPHLGETIDDTEIVCTCGWTTGFCMDAGNVVRLWEAHLYDVGRQASMARHPSGQDREW